MVDGGRYVGGEYPEVVDAAAHAVAITAPGSPHPALSEIVFDPAVADRGARTGLNGKAAP